MKRAGWILLAVLFLGTGLGVGVVAFWQATHQKKDSSTVVNAPSQKFRGTQLASFTPVDKVDSLQKIDLQIGNGAEAKTDSTITVQYTGAVAATGKIFESSLDIGQPFTFSLDQVIKGWTEGVPGMKVNGQRRLLIPANLAYGANSPSVDIPANSDLVFDITLLDVK